MKLKLDENLPAELLTELRAAGHDVDSVKDEGLVGVADPIVLGRAKAEGRVLLTLDKGIGDVRTYAPAELAGIILLRPPGDARRAILDFARVRLRSVLDLPVAGRLLVVTDRGIRWR